MCIRDRSIEGRIYEGDLKGEAPGSALVERLAKEARREAVIMGCDTLIVDTAGRLHVDEELMSEMEPVSYTHLDVYKRQDGFVSRFA